MVSGRQSSRKARGGAALAAALLCAALFGSCGAFEAHRAAAFSASLEAIDALLATKPIAKELEPRAEKAFSRAEMQARESSDWLSLLKRARAAEAAGAVGRYAGTADRGRKAFPRSEPIAVLAAQAYLLAGHPASALALFPTPLSRDARPGLWAEAFVEARGVGATSADYARLAEITGDARPYLGAAASALGAGDGPAARAWLGKALAAGASAPPGLLWDSGLYEELASMSDAAAGAGELALMGDAAWMAGDPSLAKRRWERSLSLEPRRSWKPYANLALLSEANAELAQTLWARLRAAFLSGPASALRDGALGAYATRLARVGRDGEAIRSLDGAFIASGSLAVLASTIRGRAQPEGRFAADLERLAAQMPGDSAVIGAAIRALVVRGLYDEAAVLADSAARRGLRLEYGWYYEAAFLAARGRFQGAVGAIDGTAAPGVAGYYALGSLHAALGETDKSVQAYTKAADSAGDDRSRCAALKALGRALGMKGDAAGAADAYKAALRADPADAEAAILARGSPRKN